MKPIIGQSATRQDARLKVTGAAKYSAEFALPGLVHAVLVTAPVARGTIESLDTAAALAVPGVLAVISHLDAPRYGALDLQALGAVGTIPGEFVLPFSSAEITYNGQAMAVVVADTFERARHAATLVRAEIAVQIPAVGLDDGGSVEKPAKFFGTVDAQYRRGRGRAGAAGGELPHAARASQSHRAARDCGKLEGRRSDDLFVEPGRQGAAGDDGSGVRGGAHQGARDLAFYRRRVRLQRFGRLAHEVACVLAARLVKRPVKLVLMRQQMFAGVGHRGECEMEMSVGARTDGRLGVLTHKTRTQGHQAQPLFFEPSGLTSRLLYEVPHFEMEHTVVRNNIAPPIFMRAPGEAPGTWALECAMDEMAYRLGVDPVEFRLQNYAQNNPESQLPWSSKQLRQCYARGQELIGWNERKLEPRQLRQGRYWIGYGMATATYPGYRTAASARCRIYSDGRAVAGSAGSDIGTGAYTVFRQVAADTLGYPLYKVVFELGDSRLPFAPVAGGSQLTASVAPAVALACEMAMAKVAALALKDRRSPLYGRQLSEIGFRAGLAILKADARKGEALSQIIRRSGQPFIEACAQAETMATAKNSEGLRQKQKAPCTSVAPHSQTDSDMEKYAFHSFGAQFCKLRVDEEMGTIRLMDWASVIDCGRVLNPRTARSQILGGVGFGIGMALCEETLYDPPTGRPVMRNLADYHIAVNADVPEIQVEFINVPDPHINSLGCRGIGEIGITGVPAAIGNAVFNATGKRLRDLPLTPDKFV